MSIHIVFIQDTNRRNMQAPADHSGIPLCRVGDRDQVVIAYAGVLWGTQVPPNQEIAFRNEVIARNEHLGLSDRIEKRDIDIWLRNQGYERVVSVGALEIEADIGKIQP